jgi:hypothetical protein
MAPVERRPFNYLAVPGTKFVFATFSRAPQFLSLLPCGFDGSAFPNPTPPSLSFFYQQMMFRAHRWLGTKERRWVNRSTNDKPLRRLLN